MIITLHTVRAYQGLQSSQQLLELALLQGRCAVPNVMSGAIALTLHLGVPEKLV